MFGVHIFYCLKIAHILALFGLASKVIPTGIRKYKKSLKKDEINSVLSFSMIFSSIDVCFIMGRSKPLGEQASACQFYN